jgi:hypothetical protein
MINRKVLCTPAAALLLLSACGGGGGSGSSAQASSAAQGEASTASFAVATAERNWLRTAMTYQFQDPFQGVEGTFVTGFVSVTSLDAVHLASVSSSPVERTSLYGNTFLPGVAHPGSIYRWVQYYEPSPLRYRAYSLYDNSEVIAAEQSTAMPETARVREAGPLYTLPAITNAGLESQDSLSWSLEADTPQTAWLCHHYGTWQKPATGGAASQMRDIRLCLKIDVAGAISDFRFEDMRF